VKAAKDLRQIAETMKLTAGGWGIMRGTGFPGCHRSQPLLDEVRMLVRQSLAGDQTAMLALVECYQGQVYGLCYRMLGHRQDAEDVAQETFVRAFRSLSSWDKGREFLPWLLAIAGNRCRTWLSQRMRRPKAVSLEEPVADRAERPERARHLAEELKVALSQVREEYRKAFLLFHEQELSYAEISAALDCPLGTVKTWVHRARREIIETLRAREAIGEVSHAMPRI
jgi:RNA polymerase sigma-70 factor, ECF subfamily